MENTFPADWKAMYMTLFHGITDAMAVCEDKVASAILAKALLDAEELYLSAADEPPAPQLP